MSHARVFSNAFPINHTRHKVVHTRVDSGHFGDNITCITAAIVHKTGVALLGHGRRDISVFSAFLQNDPGTALRVLHHDVVNHGADVYTDRSRDGADFKREVHRRFARAVKSI